VADEEVSEAQLLLQIICIRRRTAGGSPAGSSEMSVPSKTIRPAVGW
jgi:hypothetical protein